MKLPRSSILSAALLGIGVWLSGAVQPLAAAEDATAIPPAAVRAGALDLCRIVSPTFEPARDRRLQTTQTRYPGGARLTLPVAAPCPAKVSGVDV